MSVFLYGGQGGQHAGMGADLLQAHAEVFGRLAREAALDFDAPGLLREGPEELLGDTRYTQPCLTLLAAGITEVLERHGIRPEAACGLSLGEYGALSAAGVWDAPACIRLTAFRGQVMAEAAAGRSCAMSAVLNAEAEQVREICREIQEKAAREDPARFVLPVNDNCPGQTVICGDARSVEQAEAELGRNPRVRFTRLHTAAPFHTPLMEPAGQALRERFARTDFGKPRMPVAMNVTGRLLAEGEDLRELLAAQVCSPVRFREDLTALLETGAEEFWAIGPANAAAGLCKRTARALGRRVRIRTIESAEDLEQALREHERGEQREETEL